MSPFLDCFIKSSSFVFRKLIFPPHQTTLKVKALDSQSLSFLIFLVISESSADLIIGHELPECLQSEGYSAKRNGASSLPCVHTTADLVPFKETNWGRFDCEVILTLPLILPWKLVLVFIICLHTNRILHSDYHSSYFVTNPDLEVGHWIKLKEKMVGLCLSSQLN